MTKFNPNKVDKLAEAFGFDPELVAEINAEIIDNWMTNPPRLKLNVTLVMDEGLRAKMTALIASLAEDK